MTKKEEKYGKKIAIIHFNPIDKYPPAVNCVRYLAQRSGGFADIKVLTTAAEKTHWHLNIPGVVIDKLILLHSRLHRGQRLLKYITFNVKALWQLYSFRPDTVLYYETLSAWAPYMYTRWINKKSRLFIHYHEYTSPKEYETEMLLNKRFHKMELKLYDNAAWISHTNADRMNMFLNDIKPILPANTFILPNYPPASWKTQKHQVHASLESRIGFVYVGALSLETMYTKEMALFIATNPDKYYWDVYADTHHDEVMRFLKDLNATNIFFKGAARYDDLPGILHKYDIGVILYKGHIPNYIYNAPNKLFEYQACGLEIWFPRQMLGIQPYIREIDHPRILPVDFNTLGEFCFQSLEKQPTRSQAALAYNAEAALVPLWNAINRIV